MAAVATESTWSLLGADEDIVEDLRALGINVHEPEDPAAMDQTRRDVLASVLLRRMAEEIAEIEQLEQSRAAEIDLTCHRYATQITASLTRVSRLETAVEAIAALTKDAGGYPGKKKSRSVGAGTYGYRSYAAGVELQDEAAYIAWAEEHAPATLRVKPTMSLAQAREYLTESELAGVRREVMKVDVTALIATDPTTLPPGYVPTPAGDDYYAKPLPAAAIAGVHP